MKDFKTKFKSLGFTAGHAQLLTVAVAIFAVLFVAKSGVNLKTVFVHADTKTEMLTFDQVHNEVAAQENQSSDPTATDDSAQQLALLDRGDVDGKVLGDAIGIGEIPDADQLIVPDI
ncbi:MAG TPA: hypothetical protein VHQ20_02975, partial [Patescibacteria group bacterium]|nr:hypothetical protein [Patescibacteria group bacterium]